MLPADVYGVIAEFLAPPLFYEGTIREQWDLDGEKLYGPQCEGCNWPVEVKVSLDGTKRFSLCVCTGADYWRRTSEGVKDALSPLALIMFSRAGEKGQRAAIEWLDRKSRHDWLAPGWCHESCPDGCVTCRGTCRDEQDHRYWRVAWITQWMPSRAAKRELERALDLHRILMIRHDVRLVVMDEGAARCRLMIMNEGFWRELRYDCMRTINA